jgi:hypothetical protein
VQSGVNRQKGALFLMQGFEHKRKSTLTLLRWESDGVRPVRQTKESSPCTKGDPAHDGRLAPSTFHGGLTQVPRVRRDPMQKDGQERPLEGATQVSLSGQSRWTARYLRLSSNVGALRLGCDDLLASARAGQGRQSANAPRFSVTQSGVDVVNSGT